MNQVADHPAVAAAGPNAAAAARQPIDIGVLSGFLTALESPNDALIQRLKSGKTLCHYTTLDGAIGIVRDGDLWLSNSRYSNDDEELKYGHRVVDEVLDKMTDEAGWSPRKTWLQELRKQVEVAHGDQVYVCCFCETDNLLSQWRGYADNSGGVSIEFDRDGFREIGGQDSDHGLMRLWKVFYKPEQQREIVRTTIDYAYWPSQDDQARIRFVVDALQFFMPTFKNWDFNQEEERRLIFTPYLRPGAPQTKFRSRRGLLVPYYSLQELSRPAGAVAGNFRLPIKSMRIGPGLHRALNVQSAKMLLATHGYDQVPVEASTTPYRG